MAEAKLVEYLVKQKCFYNGAIKQAGETVYIPEDEKVSEEVFCVREKYEEPEKKQEFLPKSHGGMLAEAKVEKTEREQLEEQALTYGIKFTKRTATAELKKLIEAHNK
jgi:hypothetical protein